MKQPLSLRLVPVAACFMLSMALSGCAQEQSLTQEPETVQDTFTPTPTLSHPDWVKNLSIYEINVRQYTPEGTFKAFERHLDEIKALGTDILWFMPIHPIGAVNRKGELGSYYSVQDFKAINPEFGTLADFKHLVDEAHKRGMYVIIDYVPNHTAWDHSWIEEHPEWYLKDGDGNMQPPLGTDWTDVVQLDYSQQGLRDAMMEVLQYWVRDVGIDGYRCDVAGFVPTDFCDEVRYELDQIKPVFMLAEWEARDLHVRAFDMTYAWTLWDVMHKVGTGKANASALYSYFNRQKITIPLDYIKMNHVENHDKNSWEGVTEANFGGALEAFMALTVTAPGMPLIYNGQEANNQKALQFFKKDQIPWGAHPYRSVYSSLLKFKKDHKALWNGAEGGEMLLIENAHRDQVLAFMRDAGSDQVLYIANLSSLPVKTRLDGAFWNGAWTDLFTGHETELMPDTEISLKPYEYHVYSQK